MQIRTFGKVYGYVLKADQKLPKKEQTNWCYKTPPLDCQIRSRERMDFDFIPGEGGLQFKEKIKGSLLYQDHLDVVRSSLVKVENLRDDDNQMIKIDDFQAMTTEKQDEFLAVIPEFTIMELAQAFENSRIVTEVEAKNSK